MAIFSRDRSQITINKAKKNTSNQSEEERSRSRSNRPRNVVKKGATSTIKKKSAAVFPQSYTDDHDEEDMWLSSDNTSISSFFEDQDAISGLFHLFDESMFSNGGTTFFDGSMMYLEELSSPCRTRRSILEMEKTFEEDLEDEEEVVNWLRSSAEDDDHIFDSSWCSDSSVMSSSLGHCHEETTTYDSSSVFDSLTDVDRLSCWVSLMNLNGEDEDEDESHGSEGTDEPLFWPFERECNWNAVEEAFCMSPCSEIHRFRVGASPMSGSKARGRTIKEGYGSCRRRLVFESTPETLKSKEGSRKKGETGTEISDEKLLQGSSDIEKRIGLCEFDGHEGVDQDFNKDDFVLL